MIKQGGPRPTNMRQMRPGMPRQNAQAKPDLTRLLQVVQEGIVNDPERNRSRLNLLTALVNQMDQRQII